MSSYGVRINERITLGKQSIVDGSATSGPVITVRDGKVSGGTTDTIFRITRGKGLQVVTCEAHKP